MANPIYIFTGKPTETVRYAVTDVAQQFAAALLTENNKAVIGALITCEEENVRFGLGGTDPTQGVGAIGHLLYVGQSIKLSSGPAVSSFSYINAVAQTDGVIQVTFEFGPGA